MNHRLVYVMGPSGAGKDSVLGWLREHLPPGLRMHWARRCITRAPDAGGETHEAMTPADFEAARARGGFAMHWHANGLDYGIAHGEFAPLAQGGWVLVNGSREYFAQARERYPGLTGLYLGASEATLLARLRARGRETEAQVQQRVARAMALPPPPGVIEVLNDADLASAGRQVLQALARLEGWSGA